MPAKLLFTLICDDAREEKSGKLVIIGLYNYSIIFRGLPPQGLDLLAGPGKGRAQRFALPQLCLVRRWYVDSPGQRVRTELIEPDGKATVISETELPVPRTDDYYQEILRIVGIIISPGLYTIRTTAEKYEYKEHFEVRVA